MSRCWSSQCYSYCWELTVLPRRTNGLLGSWNISDFPPCCCDKILWSKKLRAERDLFCLPDPGYKPSQPGVTAAGPSGSWSHRTYSQGEDGCMLATQFLSPFMQSRIPSRGMTVPIFKEDLSVSVNAIKTTHCRNCSMSLLWSDPGFCIVDS